MGGCCASSRKSQLHGTPPLYYYCPPALEENEPLTSNDGATSAHTVQFLVDLNLETSIPDAYRAPPVPLPYDMVFGRPHSINSDSVREIIRGNGFPTLDTCVDLELKDLEIPDSSLASPKKTEFSILSELKILPIEEEDCCPICLEDFDIDNPSTITKCQHYFHLSCILEWMERSNTCAICDQEMIIENTIS